jgi:hypothetical protein
MRDIGEMDFVKELTERCKAINKKTEKIEVEAVEVPIEMQVSGELYSIFRRSNKEHNQRVMINMPLNEAVFWTTVLNQREKNKRDQMPNIPEEVFFFEAVQNKSEAENIFWNPKMPLDKLYNV